MSFDKGIGSVVYPGIQKVVSASYSRSHGITPDVCQIEMSPQSLSPSDDGYTPIEPDGYLLFQFDEYTNGAVTGTTQILMQGCRPDRASVRRSDKSDVWTIPIYDRRWKWKFGSFSGHWNIKKNGRIEERKKKTPRELATMCLEAMGEKRYDVSALADLENLRSLSYRDMIFPEVHWDRIPPAQALNELVNRLGYRVCLKWDDTVAICKYGEGALLPTEDLMSGGFEADLPEVSDSVTVLGGITMHEAVWELEAVGLDIDGEWRPIDHLSYVPVDKDTGERTWKYSEPGAFDGILATYQEIEDKKTDGVPVNEDEYRKRKEQYSLALQTVYRSYRLKMPAGTLDKTSLRDKYDRFGKQLAELVEDGQRPGDRRYDSTYEKYTEAFREWFAKSECVIPGPQKKDPRTGREGDYVLEEFEQILPTFRTRAELAVDSYSGKLTRRPPEVTGIYYDPAKAYNTDSVSTPLQTVEGDKFDVIPELGIIRFREPMYRMVETEIRQGGGKVQKATLPQPARLFVRIATPLKNAVGEPARYEHREELARKYRTTPAKLPGGVSHRGKVPRGTGTKVVIKNEIVLAYRANYTFGSKFLFREDNYYLDDVDNNEETENLRQQALAAIDVENLRIITRDSGSGNYAGLKKIDLDGAIQQVTISRNTTGGMTTTIARNSEVNPIVPSFDERQRNEALKAMINQQNQTVDNTQQVNSEGS